MKTSPELLTDILGVLIKIDNKIDKLSSQSPMSVIMGGGILSKMTGKNDIGAVGKMANDIKKLNTELTKLNITKLNSLIKSIDTYQNIKIKRNEQKTSKISAIGESAKDMAKALLYTGAAIGVFALSFKIAESTLDMKPVAILGFILLTVGVLAMSMLMISGANTMGLKYEKLSGVRTSSVNKNRNKSAIENAKEMGLAFMYIAGGILALSLGLAASAAILGTSLALTPIAILGVITVISASMWILSKITGSGKGKSKTSASENAKEMGLAFMYIAGGMLALAAATALSALILGTSVLLAPIAILGVITVMGASMWILSKLIASKDGEGAAENAKNMGIAFMYIAGGILAMSITLALLPVLLKTKSILTGILIISGIIVGMAGLMALLSLAAPYLKRGIIAAKGIGIAMMILSAGVIVVALASKLLLTLFKPSDKKNELKGPLAPLGNAAIALGTFGLFVAASAGMLWLLGIPMVSEPIILGSVALLGMAMSLIAVSYAIKKVSDVMKTMNMLQIKQNVSDMVGGVMSGIIKGVMGSGIDKNGDDNLSLKELRQFRRVTKAIRMLSRVSKSLTDFARGLKAFSTVGEVASLEYKENKETGELEPVIGKKGKIHVVEISRAIADTFGLFITTLVKSTENLTRKQAKAIKKLGKALTGDRGIISAVLDFSTVLKTFAEYGKKNEIYVPSMVDPNDSSKIIRKAQHVKVTDIVTNIIGSFTKFASSLAAQASNFEIGSTLGKKMTKFNEALIGKKRSTIGGWFLPDKPGIIEGLTTFTSMIAQFGNTKAGTVPVMDENGKIKIKSVNLIAYAIGTNIKMFIDSLSAQLSGTSGEKINKSTKNIQNQLLSINNVFNQLDKLSTSLTGIDKLANSMNKLATSMQLLVTNTNAMDMNKFSKITSTTSNAGSKISEQSSTKTFSSNSNSPSNMSSNDWEKIADRIASKLAVSINTGKNGTFDFIFHDSNKGKIEIKYP